MKKHTKAALLSAFVFPGLGHMIVKKYVAGGILLALALSSLIFLIADAVQQALELSAKLQSGEVGLDSASISQLLSGQVTGTEALLGNIATLVLVLCWLIGIIDSYRAGRALENQQEQN